MRPSPELRRVITGVLARAQEQYPVRICALSFLSNHYHGLLEVDDAEQLSGFMHHVGTNLSKEIGRLVGWRGKLWWSRYRSIPVSHEEAAQVERLKYILANSVKEGLVERPEDWPGLNSARALLTGEPLEGMWYDRTRQWAACTRGTEAGESEFAREQALHLEPLPCWRHLPPEQVRSRVAELIEHIVAEAAAERRRSGKEVLGAAAAEAQEPHERPAKLKKSRAPLVHAATRAVRRELKEAYALFLTAFRQASAKLRSGDRTAVFPPGSFPPRLPFVVPEPQPP
jgi:REP element-mobilizing transposase RayT